MTDASDTLTQGIHHAGLNVPDLQWAKRFFEEALGFRQVGEVPDYPAVFVSDGSVMFTLWQAEDPSSAIRADRRKVLGLHHIAIRAASQEALETLAKRVKSFDGVELEFEPEPLRGGPTQHMMFFLQGNIRLEIIVPRSA